MKMNFSKFCMSQVKIFVLFRIFYRILSISSGSTNQRYTIPVNGTSCLCLQLFSLQIRGGGCQKESSNSDQLGWLYGWLEGS